MGIGNLLLDEDALLIKLVIFLLILPHLIYCCYSFKNNPYNKMEPTFHVLSKSKDSHT